MLFCSELAGKIMFDVCGKREYQLPAGAEESDTYEGW